MALHRMFLFRKLVSTLPVLSPRPFSLKYLPSSTDYQKRSIYITNWNLKNVQTIPSHGELIKRLEITLPELVRDMTQEDDMHLKLPETMKWRYDLLEHFSLGGKYTISSTFLNSYHAFARNPSEADVRLAFIMGACFKIYSGWIQCLDDIADQCELRRGLPCWHRVHPEMVSQDTNLLQLFIHRTLSKNFRDKLYYPNALHLILKVMERVVLSFHEEMWPTKSLRNSRNLNKFNMENYNTLVEYKTVAVFFYLPAIVGMYVAGIPNPEDQREIRDILHRMERLYQIQNDYSDCFCDSDKLALRTNNDIEEAKLTWPICTALQHSNARQRTILEECYGQPDKEKVEAVVNVYEEIGIPAMFAELEQKSLDDILGKVGRLPQEWHPEFFVDLIDRSIRQIPYSSKMDVQL